MAKEQLQDSLERTDESLRRAIAQLVEMRLGVPQCRSALDDAAKSLQSVVAEGVPEPKLRPLVQRIRANAQRVQVLLDSAAAFYYGWASATPAGPSSYAPDGQILRDGGGGRLMLNA
jgi:hypothetical protein